MEIAAFIRRGDLLHHFLLPDPGRRIALGVRMESLDEGEVEGAQGFPPELAAGPLAFLALEALFRRLTAPSLSASRGRFRAVSLLHSASKGFLDRLAGGLGAGTQDLLVQLQAEDLFDGLADGPELFRFLRRQFLGEGPFIPAIEKLTGGHLRRSDGKCDIEKFDDELTHHLALPNAELE